ncbi:hypothetical protein TVAG_093210 [Trichomonas vaginalis G3]|uniref:Uncharacterized protein n=1 Tax=Trichomonas vaginalis (strain ATCC PRA-98 / G3) TaxID=412133 RepID=A2DBE4_TRIV3|nr:protein ubiquitination [Trichomonas vaginalis G3]EAY22147.1 hypothetical protein TVAG_093210 [Trichomonas vaginalis G3]KAI5533405.1 protein ubiquitination [Trichomonas vaginalis G3]|eukprot:XP_001583133.1 hypothetical protein [Trichomonas vaginalis G3]
MSKDIIQNYEDIASRISDYIKEGNFFYIFEIEDIKKIMKNSNFTANDFVTLIEQSHHTIKANELYICTRNTNIHIQSFEDVISTLKSVKKYMKLGILNGIIDFLDQKAKEMSDSTEKIQKLQTELNKIQKQKQKSDNEIKSLQSQLNQINETTNQEAFLEKISELKKSDDFESIYNFFEELSSQGNQTIISKACEEGLWKKMTPKDSKYDESRNVLHEACKKGNLKLVKSLIECGCDKETRSYYDFTPLICASREGHLEVVKYLISIGADKEAKDSNGCTPLIQASNSGKHEIIKYLISIGADKEAKDQWGNTPLI